MKLAALVMQETGLPEENIMLLRHFNFIDRLLELGGTVHEFTALQPTDSKYDFLATGKPPIEVVAVVVHDRVAAIYRVHGIREEGMRDALSSPADTQINKERKLDKDVPARRFDLRPIPSASLGATVTGWRAKKSARWPGQTETCFGPSP